MSGASLPSWARKGVKVVVVDASPSPRGNLMPFAVGDVVTIRGTRAHDGSVLLEEHDDVIAVGCKTVRPYGFLVHRFRPLVSTKTEAEDVAMFHDIARQKLPEAV